MLTIKKIFLFAALLMTGILNGYDVLVSVAPDKYFVEQIADGTLNVGLMVPAGASSHTYEPTPRQMVEASKADLWFQIGESFEQRAGRSLKEHNPRLELIDLRQGVDLIHEHSCCHGHHHASCIDPHFWLSARQAKVQAGTIARALIKRYPQYKERYEQNLRKFLELLNNLDREISAILQPLKERTILVSHPAYAYFCRDYNLKQLSIECEGKDPTPQQLTALLQQARTAHTNKVFIQIQYSNKGARLIAEELGARVITLDPYAERYPEAMLSIAKAIADP